MYSVTLYTYTVTLTNTRSHSYNTMCSAGNGGEVLCGGGVGGGGGGQAFHTRQRGPASTLITGCLATLTVI